MLGEVTVPVMTPTVERPAAASRLAGIVAVMEVGLVTVVINEVGMPLQALQKVTTDEPLTKPEPVTVRVTGLVEPAVALSGVIAEIAACAILKAREPDDTPVIASETLTAADPAPATKLAGTEATICEAVAETMDKGVVTPLASQFTMVEAVGRFVPDRVRLNGDCPAVADVGLSVPKAGFGLMVKGSVEPVPEPLSTPT